MAINLSKGERVTIENSIKFALVGLGWDTNKYDSSADFDLDASVFLLDANGKGTCDEDLVFYNSKRSRNNAVVHTGDNRTGDGSGDDESIMIEFDKIPANIEKIAVCVTIHDAINRKQNFGQVSNAYIRLAKMEDEFDTVGEQVLRFDLEEEFSLETALIMAEIYKKNGEWKFKAVASGFNNGDLGTLCEHFGLK